MVSPFSRVLGFIHDMVETLEKGNNNRNERVAMLTLNQFNQFTYSCQTKLFNSKMIIFWK